jgi:hypothetical protein
MANIAVHAWEFVYDLSAVGGSYQLHYPFVLVYDLSAVGGSYQFH